MGFSKQEYWSGLPFPSPGDLPDPGIEPGSPAPQADALPSGPPGKPKYLHSIYSTAHVTVVTLKMLIHELFRTIQGSGWRSYGAERNRMLPNDTRLLMQL